MRLIFSQREIVMPPLWHLSLLVLHDHQRINDTSSGIFRLDYVVHEPTFGCFQRICECLLVLSSLLLNVLPSKDDLASSLGSYHCDFSRGPCVGEVSLQMLGGHDIVGAAVGFAGDERYLRHGGFSICEQELSSMLDNATEFLGGSRKEAGNVSKGHDGDVEAIAEADETGSFDGGVDIEAAGEDLRLVGYHADHLAFDLGKPGNHGHRGSRRGLEVGWLPCRPLGLRPRQTR